MNGKNCTGIGAHGSLKRKEGNRRAGYTDFFCAVTYSRSAALMRLW
jgi:hypothetical protein